MARDLRKRITLAVIIPLVLGMLIITAVTCVPLYLEYKNYISNYDNHMVSDEKHNMLELSKIISVRQSNGCLFFSAALAQLVSNLITSFYYGRVKFNNHINDYIISENSTEENFTAYAYGVSAVHPDNMEQDSHYINTTYFYYFLQPLIELGVNYPDTVSVVHTTYSNDFFAFFPANESLLEDFKEKSVQGSFDTSLYWNSSASTYSSTVKLAFIPGHFSMVCKPLFISPNKIGTLPCIVYSLENLATPYGSSYSNNEALYIVDQNLITYYPPDLNTQDFCSIAFGLSCSSNPSPEPDFEFSKSTKAPILETGYDSSDIDKNIFKLISAIKNHDNYTSSPIEYSLNDTTKIMAVSGINISLPIMQGSTTYFSAVITTPRSKLSRKFDKLSSKLTVTIIIQISVFSAILVVMIFTVCIVSYKITSSVISPIEDLCNILKRLDKDLGVDVKSHIRKGPPEVMNLYEVFDRLRLILRFEDAQLFKDPAYAMMNYAQALKLFHNFNNKRAMEICFQEIAHIHMESERFLEAAINYHCAYLIAEEIHLPNVELAAKKVNMAKAMMKANVQLERAKGLFYEALAFYNSQENSIKINIYLELVESLLNIKDRVEDEMGKLYEIINNEEISEIIWQKWFYLKGLQAFNQKHFQDAVAYCTESLESFAYFDRETRLKSLKIIHKVFKNFKIPLDQVKSLEASLSPGPKDLVFVVDSKLGGAISDQLLQNLIEKTVEPLDRVSFLQFDETCSIICNLTKLPKRRCSTSTSLFDSKSDYVLYDAIDMALTQISAVKSLKPSSFLSIEVPRKEWIIVISNGEDVRSKITESKLIGKLYQSNANLVFIAVSTSLEVISMLRDIANITPFGIVLPVMDFCDVGDKLLEASAYVSQAKNI